MTITYKTTDKFPGIKFPVLHKVTYAHTTDGVEARFQHSYRDYQVRAWCENHCTAPFYMHPGYTQDKFVQFEDDGDAFMFALTWGSL